MRKSFVIMKTRLLYLRLSECNFMHSDCHAWVASPIVFIAENVFGVNSGKTDFDIPELKVFNAKIVIPDKIFKISSSENGVKYYEESRI